MSAFEDRLRLGESAILSVRECCSLIPITRGKVLAFLLKHNLIRCVGGKKTIIWGEVLSAWKTESGKEIITASTVDFSSFIDTKKG